ncbi:MAG: hypothetical protein IJW79_10810, partial [Clostridia bacterium]|nr:hypothetical protein [Clostridia bacterium]
MKIKILTLVLSLIMILSVFVACNSDNGDSATNGIQNDTPSTADPSDKKLDQYGREYIEDTVPKDLQFKNKTVTFFTRSDNAYTKMEMDTDATAADTLNDA